MISPRFHPAVAAAAVLAAAALTAAPAPAATTITSPFRGVIHYDRAEPAGVVAPRQVVMHILEVDLSDPAVDFITTPGNGSKPGQFTAQRTSQFAAQHAAQIAINADYFTYVSAGTNGEIYRDVLNLAASRGSLIAPWTTVNTKRGAINISAGNVATMVRPPTGSEGTFLTNPSLTPYNAVGGNDRMIVNGSILTTDVTIHPRTVLGYTGSKLYLFTVDGRQAGWSEGMTLVEIANLLKNEYGVQNALNLDGGGSTTLVLADPAVRVVNRPSDGSERYNGNNFGVYAASWAAWKNNASGNWSAAGNWTIPVPNAPGALAKFGSAITQARTVTLDIAPTVGRISFEGTRNYTLAGTQTLTLDETFGNAKIDVFANAAHTVSAPVRLLDHADMTINGSATVALTGALNNSAGRTINKLGTGTLRIAGAQTHGLSSVYNVQAGTLRLDSNAGSNTVATLGLVLNGTGIADIRAPQHLAYLNVNAQSRADVQAGGNRTIKTRSLAIGTGSINLNDNDLIVDHSSNVLGTWTGSVYSGITGLVQRGRAGNWMGPGLGSASAAANNGLTALAIAEAADVLGLEGSQTTTWSGHPIDATSVLVKYTYDGDANLDGKIDIDDYGRIDAASPRSGSVFGYANGDFNLDGKINVDDYGIVDRNVLAQGPSMLSGAEGTRAAAAVPEPASLATALLGASMILARRRRRGQVAQRAHRTGQRKLLR